MRICKTPALGGRVIVCTQCQSKHYIYLSCGHSHCPICQSIKREQWIDKLKNELYNVPYVHMIFTLPHELNGVIRRNRSKLYSLLMQTAWKTVETIAKDPDNIGGKPGMVNVLHTFGSDMKYHIHCHALVTFGGLDKHGKWQYPKRKAKLAKYTKINETYKTAFLNGLKLLYKKEKIEYHLNFEEVESLVINKSWVVHNTPPTIDTSILENYLSRYINRVAISKSRVSYLNEHQKVRILYNDYANQESGKAAPKAYKELNPLLFINQFLQHILPPYFQKTRRYGLHANPTKKKYAQQIPETIRRNGHTVRTVIQIINQLIKEKPYECANCQSSEYVIEIVSSDRNWIFNNINHLKVRPPPRKKPIEKYKHNEPQMSKF